MLPDCITTRINIIGTVFNAKGEVNLITNSINGKKIVLKTASSIEMDDSFTAKVAAGDGKMVIDSDLIGLKQTK